LAHIRRHAGCPNYSFAATRHLRAENKVTVASSLRELAAQHFPEPSHRFSRRTKRRAFIGKYPRRIGPNRKPTATVFGISPIFLETNGSLWTKEDIDTARGLVIVDRAKDPVS
jgi:hypothetical protein